jgi:hydroxyacyl-ACP dehydratase HTD2-like protein with hotdog domain
MPQALAPASAGLASPHSRRAAFAASAGCASRQIGVAVVSNSFADYVGRTETREDRLDARLIRGMAATLGVATPEALPPLWHWMLFQDWVMPDAIGPDGHPRRGGFLPPVHDLPRRMWAGGRVTFHAAPLRAGDAVRRTSTILSVVEKAGGTGRLVFVTVRHLVEGPAGPALEEEQDIVYRGAEGAAVKPAEPAPPGPMPWRAAWCRTRSCCSATPR